MKRLPTNFSVSQVDLFLDCNRKHFLKHVLKIPEPTNESAARGVAIHKATENVGARLAQNTPLDQALAGHDTTDAPWMAYARALAASGALPKPGEPHAREHRFELPTHLGIPFHGVIDLIRDEVTPIDIVDWKSTSDIRYAKTPIELLTNLQLNVYAHYIFENAPEHDIVRARLVYVEAKKKPLKTKLPRVVNVHVDLARESVRRLWDGETAFGDPNANGGLGYRLPAVLDEMLRTATEYDDFNDVPPTTTTCSKYGGCAYRTQCGLSPFAGVASARNHEPLKRISINEAKTLSPERDMGFLSKNSTPAPAAPVNGSAPAGVTASQTKPTGFLARAKAAGATVPATETARQARLDQDFGPKAGVPTGVVPPDAPPRAQELPQNDVQASEAAADGDPASDAPKKRGRPRKEVQAGENPPEVVAAARLIDETVRGAGRAKGFILMIDCMTTKGAGGVEATHLDDFFSTIEMELNELAAKEENLQSYWLLKFGPQKAALAMKVQERIARGLPPVMMVRSSSNAAREVLPFLIPFATQIIQSVRG